MKILTERKSVLEETWDVEKINKKRIEQWIDIVNSLNENSQYPTREILNAIFLNK